MTDPTRATIARSVNVIEGRDRASPVTDTARPTHTPGEWSRQGVGKIQEITAPAPSTANYPGIIIATIANQPGYYHLIPADELEANARLIAAAPETAAERDRLKDVVAELRECVTAAESYLRDDSRSPRRRDACLAAFRAAIARAKGE